MQEEKLIGEITETEPGNFLFSNKRITTDFKDSKGNQVEYWSERKDQSEFFKKLPKLQDYATWHVLKSHMSITTKVVHTVIPPFLAAARSRVG